MMDSKPSQGTDESIVTQVLTMDRNPRSLR
jgi:hypothetical protein